jgi:hypothetical protein
MQRTCSYKAIDIVVHLMKLVLYYFEDFVFSCFFSNIESSNPLYSLLDLLNIKTASVRIHLLCDDLVNVHACQINYKEQQETEITRLYTNSKPVRFRDDTYFC